MKNRGGPDGKGAGTGQRQKRIDLCQRAVPLRLRVALPLIALPVEVGLGVVTGFEDHGRIALGLGGFLERSLVLLPGVKTRGERAALELCPFERHFLCHIAEFFGCFAAAVVCTKYRCHHPGNFSYSP
jgi:hypothetical protein